MEGHKHSDHSRGHVLNTGSSLLSSLLLNPDEIGTISLCKCLTDLLITDFPSYIQDTGMQTYLFSRRNWRQTQLKFPWSNTNISQYFLDICPSLSMLNHCLTGISSTQLLWKVLMSLGPEYVVIFVLRNPDLTVFFRGIFFVKQYYYSP